MRAQADKRTSGQGQRIAGSLVRAIPLWAGLMALPAPLVAAYDVVEVPNGGTIAGTVTLIGPAPLPKGFNLVTFPDPEYCGRISNGKVLH